MAFCVSVVAVACSIHSSFLLRLQRVSDLVLVVLLMLSLSLLLYCVVVVFLVLFVDHLNSLYETTSPLVCVSLLVTSLNELCCSFLILSIAKKEQCYINF